MMATLSTKTAPPAALAKLSESIVSAKAKTPQLSFPTGQSGGEDPSLLMTCTPPIHHHAARLR